MKVHYNQNILYKDRISHKNKSVVTEAESSKQSFQKTPLKRESNDVSFGGVSFKGNYLNQLKKSFALFNTKSYNLKENLEFLEKYVGKAPVVLETNTRNWNEIQKHIIKNTNNSDVVIKEKNWTKQLLDSIASPITELPYRILNSIRKSFFGKAAQNSASNKSQNYIQRKMSTIDNPDIVNSFIGYMDSANKYKHDSEAIRHSGLMSNALKMFDSKSGNYNAVHERALTRIVTGFIPAFFLANDAYNLSRICDDDPQKADHERKMRFNQETKRVLSNAYLQLIMLGALSKWINKSKKVYIGVTAITVAITEAFSRLSNGRKLYMINKEQAIKMNIKEGKLPADYKAPDEKSENDTKAYPPAFKGSGIFRGFGLASDIPFMQNPNMGAKTIEEKVSSVNESKPLLTLSSITKWMIGTIVLGFALKRAKNIKIKPNVKINDYFNVISKKYDKFFEKITQQNYTITQTEYKQIINKLKEYDEVVAKYFENVIQNNQKSSKVKSIAKEFSSVLKNAGFDDFAQQFEHIANLKLNTSFKDIEVYNKAQEFIKERNNKVITQNLNDLFNTMKQNNLANEAEQIKAVIFDKNGVVNTNNYNKAKKLINQIAKDFEFTFTNRFKVDEGAENLKLFENAIKALKEKQPDAAQKYIETVENTINAETITLGKKSIPFVKQLADLITQPIKFIWGTIILPYKHIAKPLVKSINPEVELPTWTKESDLVSTAIRRITKDPIVKLPPMFGEHQGKAKIKYSKEDFAKYMNKQFNKGFNTATMSSLSNSDLSALAKNTSTAATAWFLITDNHNMVMQKSNGENKAGAIQKAKERGIQELSRQFYNVLFITLFNNTFKSLYNSSLFGAQTVNTASTLVGEYTNRKAIGMPVSRQSRDEILEKEYENITSDGLKGKFFRFMSRLTGKKVLSQRENSQKK